MDHLGQFWNVHSTGAWRGLVGGTLYSACMVIGAFGGASVAHARLFVVSYATLGLIFAARFFSQDRWQLAAGFGLIGVWGFVDGWRLVRGSRKRSRRVATAEEVSDQSGAVSSYLATYLLPFLGNLPQNVGDWIAYALYFLVAITVYVRSDLALVNPTLYMLGFRVFRAKIDGRTSLVVCSSDLHQGAKIEVSGPMDVVVVQRVCDTGNNE